MKAWIRIEDLRKLEDPERTSAILQLFFTPQPGTKQIEVKT